MIDKEKIIDELSSIFNYFEDSETDREFFYEIQNFLFRMKSNEFDFKANKETCKWELQNEDEAFDGDRYYETACGQAFSFFEGSKIDNEYKYCPFCGKEIEEI